MLTDFLWMEKKKKKTLQTRGDKLWQRHTIHEKPVSSQHPDEHQHDGEGEGQELSQSETPTAAKGNSAIRQNTF